MKLFLNFFLWNMECEALSLSNKPKHTSSNTVGEPVHSQHHPLSEIDFFVFV